MPNSGNPARNLGWLFGVLALRHHFKFKKILISSNNFVSATDLGRIASNYYIGFETIELINDHNGPISLTEMMTDEMIIALISSCSEFAQIKNRDSEMTELDELASFGANLKIRSGLATTAGKVNCLLQSYISRAFVKDFALSSELYYISQNAGRIARAIFEIALRRGWAQTTEACLTMAKCIEQRLWPFNSPLRFFIWGFCHLILFNPNKSNLIPKSVDMIFLHKSAQIDMIRYQGF
ncbi:unnamed protein product [Meloidogyne enterolobii]|uniref:Uncharacterized protein n=1 Tax=Meloidogyne enterolobii TaxID=390850 RepID=A0ACB1B2L7_MELEN